MREAKYIPSATNMAKFLLAYRNTAHSTMGEPPSVLFLGRPLRTRLDLVKPDLRRKVLNHQIHQAGVQERSPTRQLPIGQTVLARNYTGKDKWLPGIVQAITGFLSYKIKVGSNRIWQRHIYQLRDSSVKLDDLRNDAVDLEGEEIEAPEICPDVEDTVQSSTPAEEIVTEPDINQATTEPVVLHEETNSVTTGGGHRYPIQSHLPPERLGLNWLFRKLFVKKTV